MGCVGWTPRAQSPPNPCPGHAEPPNPFEGGVGDTGDPPPTQPSTGGTFQPSLQIPPGGWDRVGTAGDPQSPPGTGGHGCVPLLLHPVTPRCHWGVPSLCPLPLIPNSLCGQDLSRVLSLIPSWGPSRDIWQAQPAPPGGLGCHQGGDSGLVALPRWGREGYGVS